MDSPVRLLIESFHQSQAKCVLALTGGGTSAAAQLLEVPGGSKTILEVVVPYGEQALADFLGHEPDQCCSLETACDMARRAYERAAWLTSGLTEPSPRRIVALACTASLATDRPKRGEHRVFVACLSSDHLSTYSLTLAKRARDRTGEEALLDHVILNALARALQLPGSIVLRLRSDEELRTDELPPKAVQPGQTICVAPDGQWRFSAPESQTLQPRNFQPALLPGSFNPVHEGHWALAATAERLLRSSVAFELSIDNVDKPSLPDEEVRRRLRLFAWRAPVFLTRAPRFLDKAKLFPGAVFIIGADTAARLVDPKYYGAANAVTAALEQIRSQGCRFLVAKRQNSAGKCAGMEAVQIPGGFDDLFSTIPESEFRVDVSSTQIRAGSRNAQEKETSTA